MLYPNVELFDSKTRPAICEELEQDPEPLSCESGVFPEAYIYVRNLFIPHIQAFLPKHNFPEYIYISRSGDSVKRRLLNEEEVFKNNKLSKFEIINMTGIPLIEQMYLFSKAKVIISVHGAALTNILFCNKNVKIIEIASNIMTNLMHFQHIADTLCLNYQRYTDVVEMKKNDYESDIVIKNIDGFISFFKFENIV